MRNALLLTLVFAAACGGASSNGSSSSSQPTSEDTTPTTDLCATRTCPDGEHCELQDVQCVTAPCDPVPQCVTGMHPCAAVTCAADSRCEARNGRASCVPAPQAAGGVPCGASTCASGQVCCNASCGICTPPDGMCTQQFCN